MDNKRKAPRLPFPMAVEVTVKGQAAIKMNTRDMSDGGVFLEDDKNTILQMGTKLTLKVIEGMQGEDAAEISATVVRVVDDGVAVQFDTD